MYGLIFCQVLVFGWHRHSCLCADTDKNVCATRTFGPDRLLYIKVRDSAVAAFARMRGCGRKPAFWRMRLRANAATSECGYEHVRCRIAHVYLEAPGQRKRRNLTSRAPPLK